MQIVMAPAGTPDDPPTAKERCPPTAVQAGVRASRGVRRGRQEGRKSSHEIGLTIQLGKR